MELTQEFIENLRVNESALMLRVTEALGLTMEQVSAVIGLLADGNTVPFIARYRKEHTRGLDEVKIRAVEHRFAGAKNLESRRLEVTRGIFAQGKLDTTLYENIMKAATLAELEDIYAPYKKKRKTRAMTALEKGLGPLAQAMTRLENTELRIRAVDFITENAEHPELSVPSVDDALKGAMDIIAEQVALDAENRSEVKSFYLIDGKITVKGVGDEDARKTSTYQMYWDYTEKLSRVKPHRILAINRGEREKALKITLEVDEKTAGDLIKKKYPIRNDYHKAAIEDGLKRLLSPAVVREIRGEREDLAEDHGIAVFSQNLRNLLMRRPIKGTRVMGVDPGMRTGAKCACLDDTGKYLHNFVMYNHRIEEAKRLMLEGIKQYEIQLIALGNGTGSREAQEIVSQIIAEHNLDVLYTLVDEDGASVYSASGLAREEFPELDVTVRGAISIGRRLQDPLAELVKIDPKSIGVGLYQHDVNQKKLSETLDEVVSSVVNNVGVNLNTASASILRYVSGINSSLAKKIVKYREEKGKIASREELIAIPGMGPKAFEQCAGFLKIPESPEPLDNTWVHPENYPIARAIKETITATGNLSGPEAQALKESHRVGDTTIRDLMEELKKPNRDPREDYPKPLMQKGVVTFEDLYEGMIITGKIKNVVDFGAFVDLGVKETALAHISELSDRFVRDPLDLVKVGDILEFRVAGVDRDRRRVALSRKKLSCKAPPPSQPATPAAEGDGKTAGKREKEEKREREKDGKKPAPVRKRPGAATARIETDQSPPARITPSEDDGTMYSPFAEAFRKMREKSGTNEPKP